MFLCLASQTNIWSGQVKVGHPEVPRQYHGSTMAVPRQYLALLDEVSSLPEVEDDVPRHPGGEQSAGHLANRRRGLWSRDWMTGSDWSISHQLLEAGHVLQVEVAEEHRVGQVDLVPDQ